VNVSTECRVWRDGHIGENCFISAGSTLIPEVKVGDNSIVAAGSVVITDVPPNVMVAGVPSKVKKVYKL
jgi:acetyltransferase-like isoleucine patch superfamily enzyme